MKYCIICARVVNFVLKKRKRKPERYVTDLLADNLFTFIKFFFSSLKTAQNLEKYFWADPAFSFHLPKAAFRAALFLKQFQINLSKPTFIKSYQKLLKLNTFLRAVQNPKKLWHKPNSSWILNDNLNVVLKRKPCTGHAFPFMPRTNLVFIWMFKMLETGSWISERESSAEAEKK